MRKLAVILVGFAVLAAPPEARADPAAYSGAPIRGQVMDDATGKPLEGAIVVAQWELVREVIPGLVNESYGDVLNIAEAVTDRDGRYEIPGWGPIARPMFFHLEERDPAIVFFAQGYYPRYVANELRSSYSRDAMRTSRWNGKTVRLRAFTGKPQEFELQDGRFRAHVKVNGTLEEYASKLDATQAQLHWTRPTDDWKRFPHLIAALRREDARLAAAGLKPSYRIQGIDQLHGGRQAVERFLEGHDK